MLDTVLRSQSVITPEGVVPLDIGIAGEVIACVGQVGSLSGRRVIDVGESIVAPGGIDPHVHCNQPIKPPGLKPTAGSAFGQVTPDMHSSSARDVSRAALFGGTTTLVDFAIWQQNGTIRDAINRFDDHWRGRVWTDYAAHIMLLGEIPREILEEIPPLVRSGFPSFKMFTTNVFPNRTGRRVQWGNILDVFQKLAPVGGMGLIHAEDDDLVIHNYVQYLADGNTHFAHMPDVHSSLSEELAIRQAIRLAAAANVRLYIVHVSSGAGVAAIREARAAGQDVHGETLHQYALFSREHYDRPNGQIYHTYPSLKETTDCAALWDGMKDGAIETVATDGVVTNFEQKVAGSRIDDVTGGSAGIEERMVVTYSAGLARGFSLPQLADLTSTNAARLLGMYPKKGAILPGSDADLVVLEPRNGELLRAEDLHQTDYSPWAGTELRVWPVMTFLRGDLMVKDGELLTDTCGGTWVPRKTALAAVPA